MNAVAKPTVPAIGDPFAGGFYAGLISVGATVCAIIVAPKAFGEHPPAKWGKYGQDVAGAKSFFNGVANTQAMADADLALGKWAKGLEINGHRDWHIPSRDELEVIYRNLKPTAAENWTGRSGENPSALPPSYPYTSELPEKTHVTAFAEGGEEAFEAEGYYWTSTQTSPRGAWVSDFNDGHQGYDGKDVSYRVRAVRRVVIE